MRIGILTLPFNNNFGGYLQCYALKKTLEDLGHEVVVIYRRHNQNRTHDWHLLKAFINNVVRGKHTVYNKKTYEDNHVYFGGQMYQEIMPLLSPLTKPIYTAGELSKECEGQFDAIIVGSDQIWRPIYVPDVSEFFLNFTKGWDIKRIAYAASYGTDEPEFSDDKLIECSELLRLFDAVSVRESSAVKLTECMFGYPSEKVMPVLDPTMLLSAEEYNKVFNVDTAQENMCFCYFLDNNKEKMAQAKSLADVNGLRLEVMERKMQPGPPISDWLSGFAKAKVVLTDSFHGTVFSILYNKPFYAIQNSERGNARLTDLLTMFGIEDNLIIQIPKEIRYVNWDSVNTMLNKGIGLSILFLKHNL